MRFFQSVVQNLFSTYGKKRVLVVSGTIIILSVVAVSLFSSPEEVLWSYMTKHLVSLKDIVTEGGAKPQVVSEKIGDVINYLILLEAMINKNDDRECKLKEAYEKHKLYNKTATDRLSMWTSDYTKNTDMLGLVKMAANNGSDHNIDKIKYNRYPGEERGY